jgi:alkylhydroperoxidase family enzyme
VALDALAEELRVVPGRCVPLVVETDYDELIERLRTGSAAAKPAPPELRAYLDKVRLEAYRVTDGDVAALVEQGFTEDEIFEHTVATAVGAGLERLEAALAALR